MSGGNFDFTNILCANSGDADRGVPNIEDGSLRWLLYDACNFRLAVEEVC